MNFNQLAPTTIDKMVITLAQGYVCAMEHTRNVYNNTAAQLQGDVVMDGDAWLETSLSSIETSIKQQLIHLNGSVGERTAQIQHIVELFNSLDSVLAVADVRRVSPAERLKKHEPFAEEIQTALLGKFDSPSQRDIALVDAKYGVTVISESAEAVADIAHLPVTVVAAMAGTNTDAVISGWYLKGGQPYKPGSIVSEETDETAYFLRNKQLGAFLTVKSIRSVASILGVDPIIVSAVLHANTDKPLIINGWEKATSHENTESENP